ncbi:hypothetical protein SAMN05216553_10373 [Lentzea fradiae]|uniref:Uncharacterized protein n=1 Tax=Lentzea fradiae TaxID=200378 RepID=A0A1G7NKV1_9PSEU|nr:hypothetical protein [Lentzea fradiae]SDF74602.1 hypothetical protein SAMN05216553_10373 [Lentzea fradiae]
MAGSRRGCARFLLALLFGLPLTVFLVAPAMSVHIIVSGSPELAAHLPEWRWAAASSLPLALWLVRSSLRRNGRLRGRSTPVPLRWLGFLTRSLLLLGVMNVVAFVKLKPDEQATTDSTTPLLVTAASGIAVLIALRWWDRRPRRVTVEEVRAAAAEADRSLRRVRAENERVRRQAEEVRTRITKLRAQGGAPPRTKPHGRPAHRPDVDFHALRVFHRESYQCADTAHLAYQSAQTSLRVMGSLVHRARLAPHRLVMPGRAAGRARAEMRAAAEHLARSHGELRLHVEDGLGVVQELNANTSELKHEIRDSCGPQGQEWFEALEERIEQAREDRRASRHH